MKTDMDFLYKVKPITQLLVPLILTGIIIFGIAISLYLYIKQKEGRYLGTLHFLLCSSLFTLTEALIIYLGAMLHNRELSVHIHRLQQVGGVFYLMAIPYLFKKISFNIKKKLNDKVLIAGIIITLFFIVVAYVKPDLFISITEYSELGSIKETSYGRGREGLLYPVRDILVLLLFFYSLYFLIISNRKSKGNDNYTNGPLIGVIICISLSFIDISNVYTNWVTKYLPEYLDFSYTILGLSSFSLITFFALFHLNIKTIVSNTLTLKRIQNLAGVGGITLNWSDKMILLSSEFLSLFKMEQLPVKMPLYQFTDTFFSASDAREFEIILEDIEETNEHLSKTYRFFLEKREYWVQFSPAAINYGKNRKIKKIFWSVLDITTVKNNEKMIMQSHIRLEKALDEKRILANEAQSANRAKSEFLANISHEIRTPINGIMGMNHFLKESKLSDKQMECVDIIEISSNELMKTVTDILDYSKFDMGDLNIQSMLFNVRELLERIIESLPKSVEITYKISDSIPIELIGDIQRVEKVLFNICANAVKFTHEGRVDISADILDTNDNNINIIFSVKDTGIGIPKEKLDKLFLPFVQEDGSATRKYGGTGLGLSISKKLAESMNGTISVESEVGIGSDFKIIIPFKIKDEGIIESKNKLCNRSSLNILIVDDNKINQKILESLLKKIGIKYGSAGNGELAIEELKKSRYNIVLMDCHMPVLDGYETTKMIRNGEAGDINRDIPIVAITASDVPGDKAKCLSLGMDEYLTKPISPDNINYLIDLFSDRNI